MIKSNCQWLPTYLEGCFSSRKSINNNRWEPILRYIHKSPQASDSDLVDH